VFCSRTLRDRREFRRRGASKKEHPEVDTSSVLGTDGVAESNQGEAEARQAESSSVACSFSAAPAFSVAAKVGSAISAWGAKSGFEGTEVASAVNRRSILPVAMRPITGETQKDAHVREVFISVRVHRSLAQINSIYLGKYMTVLICIITHIAVLICILIRYVQN
jgi:hypothetical protein